jgi:hypothetical protein
MVKKLAEKPSAGIPEAMESRKETKASYRFLATKDDEAQKIRQAHILQTVKRVEKSGAVLVIQDTTELDFTPHRATRGLGVLSHPAHRGLKVHTALAVSMEGTPLGVIHQKVWVRDEQEVGKRHRRYGLPTAQKESQLWLETEQAVQAQLPSEVKVVVIADREADIYDYLAQERREGMAVLIRAVQDWRVKDQGGKRLWEAIRSQPVGGEMTVEVGRRCDRWPRQARVSLRWMQMQIEPPLHRQGRQNLPAIAVSVILVEEQEPPPGEKGLVWLLLTTLKVEEITQAQQCLRWYALRWQIERYHFVLKSGCQVEKLQLSDAKSLERALAIYCIIAWRLLWLTYEGRRQPTQSCETILQREEWEALCCLVDRTEQPPAEAPSLEQAIHKIACLAGFLGRKGDGSPGVKTLWRGWRALQMVVEMYRVMRNSVPPSSDG